MIDTLMGKDRKQRNPELVFSVVFKGHQVDPWQASDYTCLLETARVMRAQPSLHPLFIELWELRNRFSRPGIPGPGFRFQQVIREVGWDWSSPFEIHLTDTKSLRLLDAPWGWLKHEFREGLRVSRLGKLFKPKQTEFQLSTH